MLVKECINEIVKRSASGQFSSYGLLKCAVLQGASNPLRTTKYRLKWASKRIKFYYLQAPYNFN